MFLISLGFFAGMYGLYMVEFVLYCTMDGDPNVGQTEWDSIFCIKLLFWEILVIYNMMLVYGIFNFGPMKERAMTKFDAIDAATGKEGGQIESITRADIEITKSSPA